jgi:ketosteroid isomerase-like protein
LHGSLGGLRSLTQINPTQEDGMSTITTFDLQRFTRAAEERDASTQLSMYAPDAVVTIADRITQPGSPRVLRTREEIQSWLEDMYGRDMTHSVQHTVGDATGAAYTQACKYPDGTNVLCATVIQLDGGLISDQKVVQVWDEN